MKKTIYLIKTIVSFLILLVFVFAYLLIYHVNRSNKYINDFKHQKTVYYENKKIDNTIVELVKKDSLVTNNVIDKKYVSLLAKNPEDGKYTSYLYQYYSGKKIGIEKIFKSKDGYELFVNKTREMCNFKYPKFVCDDLMDNSDKSYEVFDNKINVYFNKTELLKDMTENYMVEINYVELIVDDQNVLNFTFNLDANYENPNVFKLDPNKPTIAFSFDDGPAPNTKEIVDHLSDYHFKATFFVVGNRLPNYGKYMKYAYDHGMEIGNHSYDHTNLAKLKNGKLAENINRSNNAIKEIIGVDAFIIRPPYGAINDYVKESLPNAFALWSVDTNDWLHRDSEYVKNYVLANANDGDIVLMHDIHASTKDAVINVLKDLYLKGYQVTTISELAALKGRTLEEHHAYRSFK